MKEIPLSLYERTNPALYPKKQENVGHLCQNAEAHTKLVQQFAKKNTKIQNTLPGISAGNCCYPVRCCICYCNLAFF